MRVCVRFPSLRACVYVADFCGYTWDLPQKDQINKMLPFRLVSCSKGERQLGSVDKVAVDNVVRPAHLSRMLTA